ncbi:MAG: DUF5684 domain-containing protein, partial [Planctomycetota bacterium]
MSSLQALALLQETGEPSPLATIVGLAVAVVVFAGMWKVFSKAGQAGWYVLIPIVNLYVLCKVAGRSGWWVLLFFIPIISLIPTIIIPLDVARSFGKGFLF